MWQSHVSLIYCTLVSVKQAPWNLSRMRLLQSGAARLEVFRSVSHTVLSSSPSLPKAVFHSSTSSQIFIEASLSNTCHGDTTLRVAPTTKTPQPLHITGPRSISRPLEFEEVPLWALLHLAFSMEAVQCWKKKKKSVIGLLMALTGSASWCRSYSIPHEATGLSSSHSRRTVWCSYLHFLLDVTVMTAMYRQDFVRMAVHAAVFSQDWETERLLAKEPQATVWLATPAIF